MLRMEHKEGFSLGRQCLLPKLVGRCTDTPHIILDPLRGIIVFDHLFS